jgi:predicted small metal-binding protein
MAKLIVCREVGFDCDAEVRAETAEEALALAAGHVQSVHGIADVTPDLIDAVVARIRDVPAVVAPAN